MVREYKEGKANTVLGNVVRIFLSVLSEIQREGRNLRFSNLNLIRIQIVEVAQGEKEEKKKTKWSCKGASYIHY